MQPSRCNCFQFLSSSACGYIFSWHPFHLLSLLHSLFHHFSDPSLQALSALALLVAFLGQRAFFSQAYQILISNAAIICCGCCTTKLFAAGCSALTQTHYTNKLPNKMQTNKTCTQLLYNCLLHCKFFWAVFCTLHAVLGGYWGGAA